MVRRVADHMAMLSALPDGKLDYQPHPKCRTARSIMGHLLSHVDAINDLLAAITLRRRSSACRFVSADNLVHSKSRGSSVAGEWATSIARVI